jgi:hypothetical protein
VTLGGAGILLSSPGSVAASVPPLLPNFDESRFLADSTGIVVVLSRPLAERLARTLRGLGRGTRPFHWIEFSFFDSVVGALHTDEVCNAR